MISSISLHPFFVHFPVGLYVAGLILLCISRWRGEARWADAAALNISLGFLGSVVAAFSGMVAVDLGRWTTAEAEGHQGYSFLLVFFYGVSMVYAYTRRYSATAVIFYALTLLALAASVYSGYALVFQPPG
jgi:uncharacterized membrane protein